MAETLVDVRCFVEPPCSVVRAFDRHYRLGLDFTPVDGVVQL